MTKKTCKNPNCRLLFTPDPFNHHHQEYCRQPACQRYRDARRQKRWRSKKSDDPVFRRQEVKRVQLYRERIANRPNSTKPAPETVSRENDRRKTADMAALSESVQRQEMIITGIAAQLVGETVTDSVLPFLDKCFERGRDLSCHAMAIESAFLTRRHP